MDDFSFDFAFDPFDLAGDETELETVQTLDKPLLFARQMERRATIAAQKQENLAKLIPSLPPPDVDLFVLGSAEGAEHSRSGLIDTGAFDFGSAIPHFVQLMGNQGVTAYVSTWIMNRSHVEQFSAMLDAGQLASLHFLGDPFIKRRHTVSVYAMFVEVIQAHPGCRLKLFPNHAKILCLADAAGERFLTVQGSSNLTAVQRVEQYVFSSAPELFQFYVTEFFERFLPHATSK